MGRVKKAVFTERKNVIKHCQENKDTMKKQDSAVIQVDGKKLKYEEVKSDDSLSLEINKRLVTMKDENNKTVHVCKVCEKQSNKKAKIMRHIETHLEGFSHQCKYCDVVKKTRGSLDFHEWQYHTGPNAKITQEN